MTQCGLNRGSWLIVGAVCSGDFENKVLREVATCEDQVWQAIWIQEYVEVSGLKCCEIPGFGLTPPLLFPFFAFFFFFFPFPSSVDDAAHRRLSRHHHRSHSSTGVSPHDALGWGTLHFPMSFHAITFYL